MDRGIDPYAYVCYNTIAFLLQGPFRKYLFMDSSSKVKNKKIKGARPTAKDVARLAGVSQSTVSRVLSGDPSPFFSKATRKRVMGAATELGYTPNPIARALRGKQTQMIGLIVRGMSDPFFAELVSALSIQARELGYQMVLGHTHRDPSEVLQISRVLDTRHTDGVIILGDYKDDELAIREILDGRRAVVAMCRGEAQAGVITVNTDNRAGVWALLDHLTGLGHTRLAFIEGDWMGDFKERRKAFIDYLQGKGLELNPDWIPQDTDDSRGGYQAMRRLMALNDRPTAILAADDIMAIGALKAAQEAGLQIPEQVSLTGFDGIEMTQFVSPALTTVRQPIEVMSQIALKRLLDLIEGKQVNEVVSIQVQPELIVRQSTGPVSQDKQKH